MPIDELEEEGALLEELMEYARGGMAKEMRGRYGKDTPPPALAQEGEGTGEEEQPPEDPNLPGVEAVPEDEGGKPEQDDIEMLKAMLERQGQG